MKSLREVVGNVGSKYIWGLSIDDDSQSKVKHKVKSNVNNVEESPDSATMEKLRQIILDEPIVRKAIFKKNRDTFKNWFEVKDKDGKLISDSNYEIIRRFDRKSSFKQILFQAGISANIYGTGFIEKIYNEQKGTKAISPITSRKNLIDLDILDSECITKRVRNPNNESDTTYYPVYKEAKLGDSEDKLIHPTRLEVIRIDKLPYSYFGISIAKVLWNTLKSKQNGDVGAGELLNWYGRGMYDIGIEGMNTEDEKHTERQVKKHPDYLIHDEKVTVDVVNPTRIDPSPLYDLFYTNISCGIEMPKSMLLGDEKVNDANINSYYSDIENIQTIVFTPVIERIYEELFRSFGKKWDYYIVWNPSYYDKLSEAKILQTRAYSATQAKNSGIIDNGEARDILNTGIIELDVNKKITPPVQPAQKVSDPNIEPQPSVKPVSVKEDIKPVYTPFLTSFQKEMIEKIKLKGKIEEELQELRIKEANESAKKIILEKNK